MEFPEGFTLITGLRELPDGRVLVLESCEAVVKLVDFKLGRVTLVGAVGSGPGEYRRAVDLWPFRGDSSIVLDAGSLRYLVIDPAGKPVRTFPAPPTITSRAAGRYAIGTPFTVRGTDHLGRLYARQGGTVATPKGYVIDDSLPILRFDPYSKRYDTAASYRPPGPTGLVKNVGASGPFPAVVAWAVDADGRIAIVHPGDYHVDFVGPDGVKTSAPPIPWKAIPLSKALQAEWRKGDPACRLPPTRKELQQIETPRGPMTIQLNPPSEPKSWPAILPPFPRFAASFAPDGMLWVLRQSVASDSTRYDLIDASGRLVRRVVLAPRSRLAGFGARYVYVLRFDKDDVQHLQVFAHLPKS
jgi:hypothetical protein